MAKILVDVDGVINKFSADNNDKDFFTGNGYRILYNPLVSGMLLELSKSTGAELMWGTTWNDLANEHIGPVIGLPELPVVKISYEYHVPPLRFSEYISTGEAKAHSAFAQLDESFVWFDDEPDIGEHLTKLKYSHPFLHICIEPNAGLTPDAVYIAREWLAKL